jgi:hypothetical protein
MAVNYGSHEHRFAATAWFGTEGMKVSWGGVFAGVLVAMGVSMLLASLGVAIGISAVNPGTDPGALGVGAAIWGGGQLLLALFIGGMVATRVGAIIDRTTGFFEGVLVWVVSLILMAYLAGSGIASVASGAFTLLGGATQTFSAVVQQAPADSADIDVQGTVDQMTEQLRNPELVNQVASMTGLSVNEVRDTLNETATRVEANRNNPPQAAEEASRGVATLFDRARSTGALAAQAEEIRPEAASAAWLTFVALLLSLAAAVAGAMLGRSKAADAVVAGP